MSIWIKNKLAPYSYKKTLLAKRNSGYEKLLVWLEGVDQKFSFGINPNSFGMCGGSIGTNAGIRFSKEQLREIVDSMPEGSTMEIAACNHIGAVEADFEHDNGMIQVAASSFIPKDHPDKDRLVKQWQDENTVSV